MLMLLNAFRRWLEPRVRPKAKRRQPPRARLEVMALEERAVPAFLVWQVAGNHQQRLGGRAQLGRPARARSR